MGRLADRISSARMRRRRFRTARKTKRVKAKEQKHAVRLRKRIVRKEVAQQKRKVFGAKIKKLWGKTPMGKFQQMGKIGKIALIGGIVVIGGLVFMQVQKTQRETVKAIAPAIVPIASKMATGGIL